MHFHHLHFYVTDAARWRDWFVRKLGFQSASTLATEVLVQGGIEIRLSGPSSDKSSGSSSGHSSLVDRYLQQHPPGLADIAFATDQFEQVLRQAQTQTALLSVSIDATGQRQCQIQGWADLRHTIIEVSSHWILTQQAKTAQLSAIDHAVINVPQGELAAASDWYQQLFGLLPGQRFDINTAHSGLRSQVLIHPQGTLQIPINEPSSDNSQIQEFLHHNRGAGVQHVALRCADAVGAIAHFRQQGLDLISVPATYYEDLHHRPDRPLTDLSAISRQQLLLDWAQGGQQGMLLQTFTQPIFAEPTFFFEVIQRSTYVENGQTKAAQGFGEGNFQALFEAIERAQHRRGSLSANAENP